MRVDAGFGVARRALAMAALLGVSALTAKESGAQAGQRVVAPVCIGECPRVFGLRISWRDRVVHRVDGVNVTIWMPHEEVYGKTTGLALGLPISSAGNVDGIVGAALAAQTTDRLRGIGAAGLAMGADRLRGGAASGLLTLTGETRGIALSAGASLATSTVHGIVLGGLGAFAGGGVGIAGGGLATHVGGGFRGIAVGGLGLFSGRADGIAVAGGLHMARDFRGISIALVNHARSLRGLQIGAINIVADGRNPRVLPLLNWR
jgi:hypothetical protein